MHSYYLLYNVGIAEVDLDTSTWKGDDLLEIWERSTGFWVSWRGILGTNWLLYFSDTDPIELRLMLIWIRFKTKKRMWFFVWYKMDLWNSLPKDVVYRWRQTGQVLGREICWHLLTGLLIVLGPENLLGWKLLDHICSLFFLFPTCPLVIAAGDRTLTKVGPCSELVLCSFLYYVMFLYTFFLKRCCKNGLWIDS